jgi:hypothetical protein
MGKELKRGLDQFFDQFSSTRELVDSLIQAKSHSQEILILLCSRIDALASISTIEDEASGKSFMGFVTTYSGKSKLFESVSVGDLYYELDYHLWLLPGMLEKPGRIRLFSRLNEPILKLLVDSEIALTLEEAQRLIKRIQRALRKHFRVAPNQPLTKRPLASTNEVEQAVLAEFGGRQDSVRKLLIKKAFAPLISSKTLGRVLYERFRCEVIHGGRVLIDESKFFSQKEPYWKPLYSAFYGPFQFVEFPAQFLASLFSDCLQHYKKRLEATGKVPPGIHYAIFSDAQLSHLNLLDDNLLPRGRTAFPK